MENKVRCHFFGGPWDGETKDMQSAPFRLYVAVLSDIQIGIDRDLRTEIDFGQDAMYERRGPVLLDFAYYDYIR